MLFQYENDIHMHCYSYASTISFSNKFNQIQIVPTFKSLCISAVVVVVVVLLVAHVLSLSSAVLFDKIISS